MNKLIGRIYEQELLINALNSNKSELIAVYGRRRVGKTFLINQVYKNHIIFSFSGLINASLKIQLENFHILLSQKKNNNKKPTSWLEAFYQLQVFIEKNKLKKKKVIFIDEFPWLDSRKSNFLTAFDNFWNNFVSNREDLVVVICGSAASYMIKNIIKSKGGLHNRITEKINLQPFNLFETEQLLKRNNVILSRYDILQIYMCMGGIPHYLERIKPGESVVTIINRLCFLKDGFLRTEFENIFYSLFKFATNHISIITILSKVRSGLSRKEIVVKSKIKSGGTVTKTLEELMESGFIQKQIPFDGKRQSLFRLTDEYTLFYLKFIKNSNENSKENWQAIYNQNSYKIWSGFSFETICLKHINQIRVGLKIAGIHTISGSWVEKNKHQGAQIDLLIDRADNIINLCEIKFYNDKFLISKSYANILRNKVNTFKIKTKTKKNIFITMITTYGVKQNQYSLQYVQNQIVIDDLFNKTT
ncbi:MAG: AAA family ATPase [Flavobacteriaceae bacterium]|nr:AAA family ATPase [Flavobacteriaceae bacterium]